MDLKVCTYAKILKLRGCYLAPKEDPSVFDDPVTPTEQNLAEEEKEEMCQLNLQSNYSGFCFKPQVLVDEYVKCKQEDEKTT